MSSPSGLPLDEPPMQYKVLFSQSSDNLPEPLPSLETIEAAPFIKKLSFRCIVGISSSYVAKYGYDVEFLEAENMMFVHQHTDILVPKVFVVYRRCTRPGKCITYIIMERLTGQSLDNLWNDLNHEQKLDISRQLKLSFESLRSIPHQGFFGSLGKTKLRDLLLKQRLQSGL